MPDPESHNELSQGWGQNVIILLVAKIFWAKVEAWVHGGEQLANDIYIKTLLWPCLSPICFSCLEGAGSMCTACAAETGQVMWPTASPASFLGHRCEPWWAWAWPHGRVRLPALGGNASTKPWPPTQSEHRWTDILPEVVTLGAFFSPHALLLINWQAALDIVKSKFEKQWFTADFQNQPGCLVAMQRLYPSCGAHCGDLHLCHNLSSWQCAPYSFQSNHVLL